VFAQSAKTEADLLLGFVNPHPPPLALHEPKRATGARKSRRQRQNGPHHEEPFGYAPA